MKPSLEIAPPITQLDSHFLFAIAEFHQSRSDVGGIKISIDPHLVASRPNGQLTRRLHVKGVCVCGGGGEGRGSCSHLVSAYVYGRPNRAFTIQLHR